MADLEDTGGSRVQGTYDIEVASSSAPVLLHRSIIPLQYSLDFSVHIEWCFEFLCVQKLLNFNLGAVLLRLSNFEKYGSPV